ncbi:MAG: DUF4392 domain-containing protein [Hyphomicrobiales bacterium]|nr:DUF4392 domain-containing protein [Hyphomicrobiales bacterium]
MSDIVGQMVDRLITVELKNPGMPHGFLVDLYEAALNEGGGRPLTARAAELLKEAVSKGDTVFLLTGAGYPPQMPTGESDGPPGAAVLARMLYWGLNAVPVYLCEKKHEGPIRASSEAADVMIHPIDLAIDRGFGAGLLTAPDRQEEVEAWSAEIFERYDPKAIVCIERLGPASDGRVYNATGIVKGPETEIVDLAPLLSEAARRGVGSIGIGDHGNEIGFGRIQSAVREIMPAGKTNACTVATDVLIPCMMSNWGASGIAAQLSYLIGRTDLAHGPEQERRIVEACLAAGGLEAHMCTKRFIVDGAEGESSMAIAQLLKNMVQLFATAPSTGVAH